MTSCSPGCVRPRLRTRAEHCKVCHQTFAGTTAGDSHRTGRHGVDRRCRSTDELVAGGMWLFNGVWHGVWNEAGVQRRRKT